MRRRWARGSPGRFAGSGSLLCALLPPPLLPIFLRKSLPGSLHRAYSALVTARNRGGEPAKCTALPLGREVLS